MCQVTVVDLRTNRRHLFRVEALKVRAAKAQNPDIPSIFRGSPMCMFKQGEAFFQAPQLARSCRAVAEATGDPETPTAYAWRV